MADTRDATIYRYVQGTLETVAEMHARTFDEEPDHMSKTARAGYHTGVRGVAGKDETSREVDASSKRMVSDVVDRVAKIAGNDGWVLTGGIPEVSAHISQALHSTANGRVRQVPGLDIHATDAQLVSAAKDAASALRNEQVSSVLSDMVNRHVAHDMAAFGLPATEQVLQQKRVRDLFFTARFMEEHPRHAEDAVREALDQSAAIEEVGGEAAAQLDQMGGIGARLRYSLQPVVS
jgi:stalled ribosome rescue protein Dom34